LGIVFLVSIIAERGGQIMAEQIAWEENLEKAKSRALKEDKPVFLDFYNPG